MDTTESDLHLEDFFKETISKSVDRMTPTVCTLLEKTLRKLEIRII